MGLLSQISYRIFRPPLCSYCHLRLIERTSNCVVCGVPLETGVVPLFRYVSIRWYVNHHQVLCTANDALQAKAALKELRLVKRGIANVKRQVMEAKRKLRADYTQKIRGLPLKFFAYTQAPAYRAVLADNLAPLEAEQRTIETLRIRVEQLIVQIDAQLSR
jgi:hypothetical protein